MTWRLPGGASDQARSPARTCFQKAITLAQRQQAKTFELRAAMSLARLWQGQGETAAAAAAAAADVVCDSRLVHRRV